MEVKPRPVSVLFEGIRGPGLLPLTFLLDLNPTVSKYLINRVITSSLNL